MVLYPSFRVRVSFILQGYRAFFIFTAIIVHYLGKKYVGKRVNLQVEDSLLKIYNDDELITVHFLKNQVEKRSLEEYQALVGDTI